MGSLNCWRRYLVVINTVLLVIILLLLAVNYCHCRKLNNCKPQQHGGCGGGKQGGGGWSNQSQGQGQGLALGVGGVQVLDGSGSPEGPSKIGECMKLATQHLRECMDAARGLSPAERSAAISSCRNTFQGELVTCRTENGSTQASLL